MTLLRGAGHFLRFGEDFDQRTEEREELRDGVARESVDIERVSFGVKSDRDVKQRYRRRSLDRKRRSISRSASSVNLPPLP
jgi:hypothetical protein